MKKIFFSCLVYMLLSGCVYNKNINPDNYTLFDDKGALKECPLPDSSYKLDKIECFIESSGSMSGFFQANKRTGFKMDVWSVLNEFSDKIDSVHLFRDASEPIEKISLNKFRSDMNSGNFRFAGSTQIPQMLRDVVHSIGKNKVGMFISDMKYSPMGSQADVLLTQYGTDIKNVIKNTPFAFSIIGVTSSYIISKGKEMEKSPYYMILIGNDLLVSKITQRIIQNIPKENFLGELSFFRKDFVVPMYSLLANKGITNGITYESKNGLYYTIGDANKESSVSFYLAVDFSKLPYYLQTDNKKLMEQLEVKVDKAKSVVEEVMDSASFDFGNGSKEVAKKVHATHFIKIKVWNMLGSTTLVSVDVKRKDAGWTASVCGAKSESEYDKTVSFEQLISGLKGAYNIDKLSKSYYMEPFVILISEGKR